MCTAIIKSGEKRSRGTSDWLAAVLGKNQKSRGLQVNPLMEPRMGLCIT